MLDHILRRVSATPMLPELRVALERIIEQDWTIEPFEAQDAAGLTSCLEGIFHHLSGDDPSHARPFLLAWQTLRATILRLDHLQDDDPDGARSFEASLPTSQRYNLALACYVLAMSLLDDLDERHIPATRIRRVVRLWNDNLVRAASGQQRDLAHTSSNRTPAAMLEYYEEAMRAKAGSIYVIGFGGMAMLATNDQDVIEAVSQVGEIYGTLLQYSDDIYDAPEQSSSALTLSQVYSAALAASGIAVPEHTVHHYGEHIYRAYTYQLCQIVAVLPQVLQLTILELFRLTFPLLYDQTRHDP